MNKKIRIAIDGPSASGKSTIARRIADKYNLTYVDTGAMYRCVAYYMVKHQIDLNDEEKIIECLDTIHIKLTMDNKVLLNHQDVSKEIRSNEMSLAGSKVSSYQKVREFLVLKQQEMAKDGNVILEGRDIGTVVIPDAELKIYQISDVKKRAERRYKENLEKGINCTLEEIEEQIKKRDFDDINRTHSPLKKADDAIVIDTTNLTIEEVVDEISKKIEELI